MKVQYKVRAEKGRVYWKIFVDTHELATGFDLDYTKDIIRSNIFGFVRRKDGAILRAANMKAPEVRTKNPVRGYIWEEDAGSTFTWTGINYDMGS